MCNLYCNMFTLQAYSNTYNLKDFFSFFNQLFIFPVTTHSKNTVLSFIETFCLWVSDYFKSYSMGSRGEPCIANSHIFMSTISCF